METLVLPHLSEHPLRICLFANVRNSHFLRQQLLEGNQDFEYAFLDISILLSRSQVLAACFKAINDSLRSRFKSRNVHSEIVFALSPNNNISESFRRFGISDDSKNLLAIKVGGDAIETESHLKENVKGEPRAFTDQAMLDLCDPERLRKVYRVNLKKDDVSALEEAEAYVLGSMALKGS